MSMPRGTPSANDPSYERVFGTVAVLADGHNRLHGGAHRDPRAILPRPPRADGGIGRRARLRAWSGLTGWRFESSSAHLGKPRAERGFSRSRAAGLVRRAAAADALCGNGSNWKLLQVAPRRSP